MMPREVISFQRAETVRSDSGQRVKKWEPVPVLTNIPAERRKRKVSNDVTLNAKEEFIDLSITFWVRYDESITDNLRIIYNGQIYRILDIDRKFHDNSCLITCVKVND
ncbi:phage head closure protein [Bacteroides cellulosilyticus]|jgi:SPP1 family predicted phage head-tail adaptor|uniref:Phage head closure protein n=2 Tax=Bacteroides cellulosilyticus TaxID=246787 RepID=A0A642PW17_9BACE|nr:phage head closure protein [Bacteroides cellulosilyticus]DAS87359.1 MAG TPA: Putative head tail adaptor [Caudoviricetes sp.]